MRSSKEKLEKESLCKRDRIIPNARPPVAPSDLFVKVALGTIPKVRDNFAMEGTYFCHHFLTFHLSVHNFYFYSVFFFFSPGEPWKQHFLEVRASIRWVLNDRVERSIPSPQNYFVLYLSEENKACIAHNATELLYQLAQPTQCKMYHVYHLKS